MFNFKSVLLAGVVALAASTGMARAGVYNVTVSTGLSGGTGFNTLPANPYPGSGNIAHASFVYTGNLDFSNAAPQNAGPAGDLNSTFGFGASNLSAYSGAGTVVLGGTPIANFATVASFLASSGSASGYQYGSYYTIDLGVLAGGTVLTITHDDGVSVYQGGTRVGATTDGPTSAVTESVTIGATGGTTLYYGRQNGTPSILRVSVPEPASLALLATGLIALGRLRRRSA